MSDLAEISRGLERLAALGTATIHEAQGRTGDVDAAVKPVWGAPALAARGFTVRCQPGDNLAIHRAVAAASRGDVLLVQADGEAVLAEGEARVAKERAMMARLADGELTLDLMELRGGLPEAGGRTQEDEP